MDSVSFSHIWAMRIWFVVLAVSIMFFHLIPLDTTPPRWAPPDFLIAFAFAWSTRRPDFVPALSIAGVLLLADLLFQRPPGLMALFVVLGCEYLKNRASGLGETSFVAEWFAVSYVILIITLLYRLSLAVTLVDRPPLAMHLLQMALTIGVYPLVAMLTQTAMGVRRLSPGDADAMGAR